ncbi:hypothetical protein QTP88_005866 [Uroleucon formosanum]
MIVVGFIPLGPNSSTTLLTPVDEMCLIFFIISKPKPQRFHSNNDIKATCFLELIFQKKLMYGNYCSTKLNLYLFNPCHFFPWIFYPILFDPDVLTCIRSSTISRFLRIQLSVIQLSVILI